jgi:hypothetical protein
MAALRLPDRDWGIPPSQIPVGVFHHRTVNGLCCDLLCIRHPHRRSGVILGALMVGLLISFE